MHCHMPYGEAITRKLHLVLSVSSWHYFDCGGKFAESEDRFLDDLQSTEPTRSEGPSPIEPPEKRHEE
jgi:hypothetical protein